MNQAIRLVVAVNLLAGMAWVFWTFKWWILGGCAVYAFGLMGINHVYRKAKGKDLPLYTRMMK